MPTIYAKTADGQNEIETRIRRIPPRLRSALILVDGKRSDDELGRLFQQADETLRVLLDAGLIEVSARSTARSAPREPVPEPAAAKAVAMSPSEFKTLRHEAVRAVNDLLGPQAETLALKLERAGDMAQLREPLERAVAYIANARGGSAAAQFATRFLVAPSA
jgi:D-serine deaminase-like pyridoxal phosphate-dependent protein